MTFIQQPLFDVTSDWRPTPVSQMPSWAEAKRVAVDLETCDPLLKKFGPGVRRGGYIIGIAFAIEGGPMHYLSVAHAGGDNNDPLHVWDYLKDQAKVFRGEIVGANLSYDLDYLAERGVWFENASAFRDVLVAAPLLDELQFGYSLDNVAKRAGFIGKSEDHLGRAADRWGIDKKAEMWKLPARHVAQYAMMDVALPLEVLRWQEKQIAAQELESIWELETKVLPILVKMRRRGVLIDTAKLTEIEEMGHRREDHARSQIKQLTGIAIASEDLGKAVQVENLFAAIGVRLPVTEKSGKPSFAAEVIDAIDHPLARAYSEAKQMRKLWSNVCKSIWDRLTNGRIHALLRQLKGERLGDGKSEGTAFGRMAGSQPNLQQQYARDPVLGPLWRSIFLPDEGKLWAACDFSSQEPRLTVHYGVLDELAGAAELAEKFWTDNGTDLHQQTADLCGISRKNAKTIFLGLCYGMGGGKLCIDLGLPVKTVWSKRQGRNIQIAGEEGQALLDKFDAMVPFVRELAERLDNAAQRRGYIRTILGRRCRFPIDKIRSQGGRTEYDWTYKALNRLIQGSAADQTKAAMVAAEEAGFALQLQVHDELDLSVNTREEAEEVGRIMCEAVPMKVPGKVDVEIGTSWGDSMG